MDLHGSTWIDLDLPGSTVAELILFEHLLLFFLLLVKEVKSGLPLLAAAWRCRGYPAFFFFSQNQAFRRLQHGTFRKKNGAWKKRNERELRRPDNGGEHVRVNKGALNYSSKLRAFCGARQNMIYVSLRPMNKARCG